MAVQHRMVQRTVAQAAQYLREVIISEILFFAGWINAIVNAQICTSAVSSICLLPSMLSDAY